MQTHFGSRHHNYSPRTHVRERPLHWLVILVSLLFIFLLVIESVAFVVLGAWHLTLPRLLTVQALSYDLFARELAFGILLVIVGSVGVVTSGLGLVAFYSLRLPLLRTLGWCLWAVMVVGTAVGVIGITFASQVDGLMRADANGTASESTYAETKFMLGMNGGLGLFMSLTLVVGIIMVRCLTGDVSAYESGASYFRTN